MFEKKIYKNRVQFSNFPTAFEGKYTYKNPDELIYVKRFTKYIKILILFGMCLKQHMYIYHPNQRMVLLTLLKFMFERAKKFSRKSSPKVLVLEKFV
jgi:hypothetical protein